MRVSLNNIPFEVEDYFEKFEETANGVLKGYIVILDDKFCVKQSAYKDNGMVYLADTPGKIYVKGD